MLGLLKFQASNKQMFNNANTKDFKSPKCIRSKKSIKDTIINVYENIRQTFNDIR